MVSMARHLVVVVVAVIAMRLPVAVIAMSRGGRISGPEVRRRNQRQQAVHEEPDKRQQRNEPDPIGARPRERVSNFSDFLRRQGW